MSITYQPGRYLGRITRQQLGETSKGNPQFVLTFDVLGRIDLANPNGDLIACTAGERTFFRVINENTVDYAVADLRFLGYARDSWRYLDPTVEGFHDFAGKEVEFTCGHELYEGKMTEKWQLNRQGFEVPPLDDERVRKLDTLFGKKLKGLKGQDFVPTGVAPTDAQAHGDIPF